MCVCLLEDLVEMLAALRLTCVLLLVVLELQYAARVALLRTYRKLRVGWC